MNKNIPDIRFKGFADEWKKKEYSETFKKISNNTLSRAELNYNNGIAKNVHYGDILIKFGEILDVKKDEIPYITKNNLANKLSSSNLQDGDVIMADAAEDEMVGKCSELINVDSEIVLSGLHTIACRPNFSFSLGYLGYFMNSFAYHSQLLRLMQGTKVLSISKTALQETIINYPSDSKEQTKIGNYFKNIDQLISQQQQKYDKLLTIKKAMLKKMFPQNGANVPEIRFKGFTEDWEEKSLGKVTTFIVDNRGKNPTYYCSNGIPVIDNYMIKNKPYPNLSEANRFIDDYLFENFIRKYNEIDDILITLVGNGIGNITLYPEQKCVIIQNTLGLRFSCYQKFMFYSLLSNSRQIKKLDRGMAQPSIRQDELLEVSIYCPKAEEQKKIGNYFTNLDNLINLNKQKLEKLKTIKKALLDKMFV